MSVMYCNYVDAIRSIDDLSNGNAVLSKMFAKQMLVEYRETVKGFMRNLTNEAIIVMNILFKAIVVMFGENAPNMLQFCENDCMNILSEKFNIFNQLLDLSAEDTLRKFDVQGNQAIIDVIASGITDYFQILEAELIRLLSENINTLSPFNGNDHDVFVLSMMKIKGESKIMALTRCFQSKCQTTISEAINRSIHFVYDSICCPKAPVAKPEKIIIDDPIELEYVLDLQGHTYSDPVAEPEKIIDDVPIEPEYVLDLQGYTYSDPNTEEVKFFGIRDNCQQSQRFSTMTRTIDDDDYDYVSHLSFYDSSILAQDHGLNSSIEIIFGDEQIIFEDEYQLLQFYQVVFATDAMHLQPSYCSSVEDLAVLRQLVQCVEFLTCDYAIDSSWRKEDVELFKASQTLIFNVVFDLDNVDINSMLSMEDLYTMIH